MKHFAVHSGPGAGAPHASTPWSSERDLRETYLPHFETAIRKAKRVLADVRLQPRRSARRRAAATCSRRTSSRGEWKFPGYVVSDCGAIDDMYLGHKVVPTAPEAAALGVKHETDLDCFGRVYPKLVEAVQQGQITEARDRRVGARGSSSRA